MEIQLWREILNPYDLAVKELIVKFEHLIYEHRSRGMYSPVEQVSGRVKTVASILDKAQKKNIAVDEIEEKPDVIVLDPPRDGIHPKALPKILSYGVDRIVYVSCKATSLARDLEAFLQAGYRLEKACCVDQFCQTVWTEAVALLVKE